MENHYTYEPFGRAKRNIRLLIIHPAASNDAILECSLKIHSLQEAECPKYETVSYVWDEPDSTSTIKVDGKLLKVTRTLVNGMHKCLPRIF